MSTIFEVLRQEHDQHRRLLKQLAETHGDSDERRELFSQLQTELSSHANAEERAFYAVLLSDAGSQPKSSHSIKEHQEIEEALTELAEMDFSSPQWLPKFKQLKHDVEHHESEEEQEVFQVAGKVLSEKQKHELVSTFRKEKQRELQTA